MSNAEKVELAKLNTDVVVIGSGGGLAAAVAAAENGARVILLEKENILGGYTRQANAFMACESPVQKRLKIDITRQELFRRYMNWTHWHRVEPRVVSAFINNSGETVRWLEEKGVEFEVMTNDRGLSIIHVPANMMASVQLALIKNAKKLGVNMLLNASGKKILRKKGKVTGVVAVKDGEDFEIETRCVIIATGGFSDNRVLLKNIVPSTSMTCSWTSGLIT